jgi:hypothetical protein
LVDAGVNPLPAEHAASATAHANARRPADVFRIECFTQKVPRDFSKRNGRKKSADVSLFGASIY